MSQRQPSYHACQPCRDSKVKCDQARPICSRCARRNTACHGFSDDIFRDQTAIAGDAVERRNRVSVRREESQQEAVSPTSVAGTTQDQPSDPSAAPWLNSEAKARSPQRLVNDLDHRAVEHFFSNWMMYPCNHQISPGYMSELPVLYEQSLPGGSLRLSIEALAYADIPEKHLKARSKYGAALSRIREVIGDPAKNKRDAVLCSLLIIDNFELMHKNRSEPLGPHTVGLLHLLHIRGDDQLFDYKQFSLWRIAHHRLQARQILLREEPSVEQRNWVSSLNKDYPDLHIIVHVFKMSESCGRAQAMLTSPNPRPGAARRQLQLFLDRCCASTLECKEWADNLPDAWKPQKFPYHDSLELLSCLNTISIHHDIWIAYMWNFHTASRIAMAEAYIDIITSPIYQPLLDPSFDTDAVLTEAKALIQTLSLSLLETIPHLLGFVDLTGRPRLSSRDRAGNKIGRGLGGFWSMYATFIIRASRHCPPEHKNAANKVLHWIHALNSIV